MKRLLDAPHRLLFFAAAVQILLAAAWWAAVLVGRAGGAALALPEGLQPARVHALLMIYGFFPLFIFGFLFTAGPRWLGRPPPGRAEWAPPAILAAAGAWLMLPALLAGPRAAAAALVISIVAWTWMLALFVRLIATSRARDRLHPITAAVAVGFGIVGLFLARWWFLNSSQATGGAMVAVGLFGFLVPLFATVSHRMIPFFTANAVPDVPAWRPAWTLAILVGGSFGHLALELVGLAKWTVLVDAPMGAVALLLVRRWGLSQGFASRLLAMLHVGFAWLAAAWLLHAFQSALALAGVAALGLAPLHALSVGGLASLTFAMVSRVSCGHSGRSLAADRLTWNVFLLLQATAVIRVAADLFTGAHAALLSLSALLWLACFAAWAWRYLPYYWRPRVDGKPG